LRVPPSNHFESCAAILRGPFDRVNQEWRSIFRWDGKRGEAVGAYLDDHTFDESETNHADDGTQAVYVAQTLTEEFMEPISLAQGVLAGAMGVQRKHVNDRAGNSPDFWLNVQRRSNL
jgi:hypothetical protein